MTDTQTNPHFQSETYGIFFNPELMPANKISMFLPRMQFLHYYQVIRFNDIPVDGKSLLMDLFLKHNIDFGPMHELVVWTDESNSFSKSDRMILHVSLYSSKYSITARGRDGHNYLALLKRVVKLTRGHVSQLRRYSYGKNFATMKFTYKGQRYHIRVVKASAKSKKLQTKNLKAVSDY